MECPLPLPIAHTARLDDFRTIKRPREEESEDGL